MEIETGSSDEPIKPFRQFLVGIVANLASFVVGIAIAWTSPVNPKLDNPATSPLSEKPSESEVAWIGSLATVGALIAPWIAPPMAQTIGRKLTLLCSSVLFILSWILLLIASSVTFMYVARLLMGMGMGFVMSVETMYVGEIASIEYRGAIGSLMQLFITVGILYVYAIGPYVSYAVLQYACIAIPILFAILFLFMPESPYFLIAKGRIDAAVTSLQYLRGQSKNGVKTEFSAIEQSVQESLRNKSTILDLFRSKGNIRGLIICLSLVAGQQISGIIAILFNTETIFASAGGSIPPEISAIIVAAVQIVASLVTPFIVEPLGRKPILLFSAAGMTVSHFALGLYFFLNDRKMASSLGFLPVASLIFYIASYCVGYGGIPWAIFGEMFSSEVKSPASSIVTSGCWSFGFIITLYFADVQAALGMAWTFWIFAINCAGNFLFVLLVVFETKGLTLQEIQDILNGVK